MNINYKCHFKPYIGIYIPVYIPYIVINNRMHGVENTRIYKYIINIIRNSIWIPDSGRIGYAYMH